MTVNGTVLTCRFRIAAGETRVRPTMAVWGSEPSLSAGQFPMLALVLEAVQRIAPAVGCGHLVHLGLEGVGVAVELLVLALFRDRRRGVALRQGRPARGRAARREPATRYREPHLDCDQGRYWLMSHRVVVQLI